MRSFLPDYDLRVPADLDEALRMLADGSGARPFAGGTDLMVLLEAGTLRATRYVSLWGIADLRGVRVSGEAVEIGALTTYADLLADPVLSREFPLLGLAARETGGLAIQNRGTIGGNIANASPAADTPPALLVYDAELELLSVRGSRRLPYASFHTGYKTMDLRPDEIIASIRLPRREAWTRQSYRKVGTRRAQAISKVCFAGTLTVDGGVVAEIRCAFGSVAPVCVRAHGAEAAVRGRPLSPGTIAAGRAALAQDIAPIDDMRSTSQYRGAVAANLLEEFLAGSPSNR
jgi:CO/xanthine dehydrogenase FAD-binding subunit